MSLNKSTTKSSPKMKLRSQNRFKLNTQNVTNQSKSPLNKESKYSQKTNNVCKNNEREMKVENKNKIINQQEINSISKFENSEEIYKKLTEENKKLNNELNCANNKLEIMTPSWLSDDTITTYFDILTVNVLGSKHKLV